MNARMSRFLPPALGTLFGQPIEIERKPVKAMPPASIPGAFNAPELCNLVETYRPDLMPRDAIAEVKMDGMRCLYIAGQLVTREGCPFEAASDALPVLRALEQAMGRPMFFDGEYVEDGGLEATISAFRSRAGAGCLWLFDAVPFDEWQSGKPSREGLGDRKLRLLRAYEQIGGTLKSSPVGVIGSTPVTAATVEAYAQDLWSQGYEGLVVKAECSRYMRKRTADWLKVKLRTASEMVVVDIMGCTRQGRETAKTLQVRLTGAATAPPCLLPVRGGLADTVWGARSHLVGTNVTVEHAGFTGGGQPREAVLSRITLPSANERDQ